MSDCVKTKKEINSQIAIASWNKIKIAVTLW